MISLQNKHPNAKNSIFLIWTLLLVSKLNFSYSLKSNRTNLIVGGSPFDEDNVGRYIVSIQRRTGGGSDHFCGGTIISSKKILTAAHCLYKNRGKHLIRLLYAEEIIVGIHLRSRVPGNMVAQTVASVRAHTMYGQGRTYYADVGVLTLERDLDFDQLSVSEISLPNNEPIVKQTCTVAGWGKTSEEGPSSKKLLFAQVEIFDPNYCKRKYRSRFTPGMLCAGDPLDWSKDACKGDSGGPLICNDTVVGVVSWGDGCGTDNLPGVYTDVFYFKEWISNAFCLTGNHFIIIIVVILCFVLNC